MKNTFLPLQIKSWLNKILKYDKSPNVLTQFLFILLYHPITFSISHHMIIRRVHAYFIDRTPVFSE